MENKRKEISNFNLIARFIFEVQDANDFRDYSRQAARMDLLNEMLKDLFGVYCKAFRDEKSNKLIHFDRVQVRDAKTNELIKTIAIE